MRMNSGKIVAAILASTMLLQGCQATNKEEVQTIANVEDDKPTDGFDYIVKDNGIVLTEFYGTYDEVEIPGEIEGQIVIGLTNTVFDNCTQLTRVRIPPSVETVEGGIFEKFPDVVVEGYLNTKAEDVAFTERCFYNQLGENPECAKYVRICSPETKGVVEHIRLGDGDAGEEGTYSEGASFSIENGEAILTLNNYNGGMIAAGGYGSLTIRLVEGSVNNIDAADPDNGIVVSGNLTIEGKGSLSMKAGDKGSGEGILVKGNLTIQDQVKMFVKSGMLGRITFGIFVNGGNLIINNSHVEVQAGKTGVDRQAIFVNTDVYREKGEIQLEQCHIVEGGKIVDLCCTYEGSEYRFGQGISENEIDSLIVKNIFISGAAEYVKIVPHEAVLQ